MNVHGIPFRNLYGVPRNAAEFGSIEYSEQFRGNIAELSERKSLQYEIPITKRHLRKHPIAYPIWGGGDLFLPMVITIRDCIQRKTWCMGPSAGADYNSP